MTTKRFGAVTLCGLAALAVALMCAAVPAFAAPAVFTATAAANYANPDTGAIEDAAGESNTTLGQSMVTGIVQPVALVEKDAQGKTFVTLRFKLANDIGDVLVATDASNSGQFGAESAAQNMQSLAEDEMGDYRFEVPDENATIRVNMFVEPMGRNVVYFVKLDSLVEGNPGGFVESVSAEAPAEEAPAAPTAPAEQEAQASSAASSAAAATSSAATATEEAAPKASSAQSGQGGATDIKEYSGDGTEVTGTGAQSDTKAAEGLNYPLIIGIVAVVAAIAGLVAYFGVVKPKRARQEAAAKMAAGMRSDD